MTDERNNHEKKYPVQYKINRKKRERERETEISKQA